MYCVACTNIILRTDSLTGSLSDIWEGKLNSGVCKIYIFFYYFFLGGDVPLALGRSLIFLDFTLTSEMDDYVGWRVESPVHVHVRRVGGTLQDPGQQGQPGS